MLYRGIIIALLLLPLTGIPTGAQEMAIQSTGIGTQVVNITTQPSFTEQEAIAFRRLQSELMVAAVACRDARHRAHYNIFVTRFQSMLGHNARLLKTYFQRLHGPMATRKLDTFITGLANAASLASMSDADFCINALARFEVVNYTDQNQTAGMIVEEADLALDR